jgi:hypothetical protein
MQRRGTGRKRDPSVPHANGIPIEKTGSPFASGDTRAPSTCHLMGWKVIFFPLVQLRCGTPDIKANTDDLCSLCQLRSALKRPFLARLSPRRGYQYQVPSSRPAAQREIAASAPAPPFFLSYRLSNKVV